MHKCRQNSRTPTRSCNNASSHAYVSTLTRTNAHTHTLAAQLLFQSKALLKLLILMHVWTKLVAKLGSFESFKTRLLVLVGAHIWSCYINVTNKCRQIEQIIPFQPDQSNPTKSLVCLTKVCVPALSVHSLWCLHEETLVVLPPAWWRRLMRLCGRASWTHSYL